MATSIAQSPQFVFEGTLTFASVANSASNWAEQTVNLPTGVKFPNADGFLVLKLPNLQANLMFGSNVTPVNTTSFKIRFFNATGGALTPTGTSAKLVMF